MTAATAEVGQQATTEDQEPTTPLMQLPLFEGHRTVEYRLNFGGNNLVTDQELAKALKLGGDIELTIKGRVVSRGFKQKDDKQAISSAAVVIDEVYLA